MEYQYIKKPMDSDTIIRIISTHVTDNSSFGKSRINRIATSLGRLD